jgi:LCP family protein required for cell wall assembly
MTTYADPGSRVRRRPPLKRPPVEEPEPPKRRDPLWAKLCLIIGSIVMVVSGAVVVLPRMIADWATGDIPKAPLIPPELIGANIEGSINLLLLGMDERAGNSTEPIRTDTMIIAHIPATHDKVFLISLPRDAEAFIPDYAPTNFTGWTTKINAAFSFGARDENGKPDNSTKGRSQGAALLMQTINQLVPGGITFNGAAIINFIGFRSVLAAIGGVAMCVDVETRSIHYDISGKYHTNEVPFAQRRVYKVGCRTFNPQEALDYARQRHFADGDYTRQRHQQQLLMAIFKKLTTSGTLTDVSKLTELQKAANGLLTLDLGKTQVADWIFTLKSIRSNDVVMVKTNGGMLTEGKTKGNEAFSPESIEMLKATQDDTLEEFLREHPSWIAKDK